MDAQVFINALVALVAGVGGPVGAYVVVKRQSKSTDRSTDATTTTTTQQLSQDNAQKMIDQLQEEIVSLRAQFDQYVSEMSYQGEVNRHLDDEVQELRAMLSAAGMQPPPRKPWPKRRAAA